MRKPKDFRVRAVGIEYADYYVVEDISTEKAIHSIKIKKNSTVDYIMRHKLLNKGMVYLDGIIELVDFVHRSRVNYHQPAHQDTINEEHLYNKQIVDFITPDLHKIVKSELRMVRKGLRMNVLTGLSYYANWE